MPSSLGAKVCKQFLPNFAKLISASPSAWDTRGWQHTEAFSHVAPHSQRSFSISSLGSPRALRRVLGKLLSGCVCVCVCVCVLSQWMATHPPSGKTFPLGWTILHCECSAGVSGCQLASVYYWYAVYREAKLAISSNSLQMGQGNENKACAAGSFTVWGFASKLCLSFSLGATLKLLLVWLGSDFTRRGSVRYVEGAQLEAGALLFCFSSSQKNTSSARFWDISLL